MLVRRNIVHEVVTDAEEKAAVEQAQAEDLRDNLTRWTWYITIVIERTIEVPDTECNAARWFSIDPGVAIHSEREFLQYGSYQAQFLVDHLVSFIPRHFFATQDVDDRVVFFAGKGPPFKVPQMTMGTPTVSTSSPLERCNVVDIRGALSKLQSEGQMALTPLTPVTLLTLIEKATTSDLKGRALEELVCKLFLTIPGLAVMSRIKTTTEEIDMASSTTPRGRVLSIGRGSHPRGVQELVGQVWPERVLPVGEEGGEPKRALQSQLLDLLERVCRHNRQGIASLKPTTAGDRPPHRERS